MRTQDIEDRKDGPRRHVLDPDFYKDYNLEYIDDAMRNINMTLSSPESSTVLSDLYDKKCDLETGTEADLLLSSVLLREEEEVCVSNRYERLVEFYLTYDVLKFSGCTLNDFLDLEYFKRDILIKCIIKKMETINQNVADIEEELNIASGETPLRQTDTPTR